MATNRADWPGRESDSNDSSNTGDPELTARPSSAGIMTEDEAEADIGAGRASPVHAGTAATIDALKLARERKLPYPEAVVDAEVMDQGLMVKTEGEC